MTRAIFFFLAAASACAALEGESPSPETKIPTPTMEERIQRLKTSRDPFWKPGYKPHSTTSKSTPPSPAEDLTTLALREGAKLNPQGRLKVGKKFYIMLHGRAVGQGDIIDVTGSDGKPIKMRIVAITQDNIQLEPLTN